jgi:hypothetical protein
VNANIPHRRIGVPKKLCCVARRAEMSRYCGERAVKGNVGGETACWEGIEERRSSKLVEWLIEGRN